MQYINSDEPCKTTDINNVTTSMKCTPATPYQEILRADEKFQLQVVTSHEFILIKKINKITVSEKLKKRSFSTRRNNQEFSQLISPNSLN